MFRHRWFWIVAHCHTYCTCCPPKKNPFEKRHRGPYQISRPAIVNKSRRLSMHKYSQCWYTYWKMMSLKREKRRPGPLPMQQVAAQRNKSNIWYFNISLFHLTFYWAFFSLRMVCFLVCATGWCRLYTTNVRATDSSRFANYPCGIEWSREYLEGRRFG